MIIKNIFNYKRSVFFAVIFCPFLWLSVQAQDQEEKVLNVRLEALQRKTINYETLKCEKFYLEKKIKLVTELVKSRIFWSQRLQDLAIFTNDRRVWLGQLSTRTKRTTFFDPLEETKYAFQEDHKILLKGFMFASHISDLHNYRADLISTDGWKENFLPDGINELNYQVEPWKDKEVYYSFYLEMPLKLKTFEVVLEPLRLISISEEKLLQMDNEKQRLLYTLKKEEEKIKEIEYLNAEILQLTRKSSQINLLVPNQKELETLSQVIADVSSMMRIPPFSFRPKYVPVVQEKDQDRTIDLIQGIELNLSFEATYEQIGQFLSKIENDPRLISIEELLITSPHLTPNPLFKNSRDAREETKLLQAKIKLQAYVYNEPSLKANSNTPSLGFGLPSSSIRELVAWTPDASRDIFDCYSIVEFKKEVVQNTLSKKEMEPLSEENQCRYYDLDNRCTFPKNKISDFCTKHYQLADEISRQENMLRKAKELIRKIEDAFRKNNQQLLTKYYGEMDEIFRYRIKVEWIKIEIEDIRQRFYKMKEEHAQYYGKELLAKVLPLQKETLGSFVEGDYEKCITESQNLVKMIATNLFVKDNLELQTILKDVQILQKKARICFELVCLPVEITSILWNPNNFEQSKVIINKKVFSVNMELQNGARIVEIKKREVVFFYKSENIVIKLKE